jgi:hypothetical protein
MYKYFKKTFKIISILIYIYNHGYLIKKSTRGGWHLTLIFNMINNIFSLSKN